MEICKKISKIVKGKQALVDYGNYEMNYPYGPPPKPIMNVGRGQFRGPVHHTSMVPGPMAARYQPRFMPNFRGGYQRSFYTGSHLRPPRSMQYVRSMVPPIPKRQHVAQKVVQPRLTPSSLVPASMVQAKLTSPN